MEVKKIWIALSSLILCNIIYGAEEIATSNAQFAIQEAANGSAYVLSKLNSVESQQTRDKLLKFEVNIMLRIAKLINELKRTNSDMLAIDKLSNELSMLSNACLGLLNSDSLDENSETNDADDNSLPGTDQSAISIRSILQRALQASENTTDEQEERLDSAQKLTIQTIFKQSLSA